MSKKDAEDLLDKFENDKWIGQVCRTESRDIDFNDMGRGYKTFFMLNSAELESYPAYKC